MYVFLILCLITGLSLINFIRKKEKLSNIIVLSLPIGMVFHTTIFILLAFLKIYYNKYIFISLSIVSLLSFMKRRMKIENDLKKIPIYYIIFTCYIIFRLILMASTGFFEFYNYDEFTAYQTGSTIIYLSHGFEQLFKVYAPINYFIGVMSLEFTGLSITSVRIVSVIFFGLLSLGIYSKLREENVNTHISALIAMLFLVSSSEILQLAKSFYTNIFFMFYFTIGVYGMVKHYIINNNKNLPWLYLIICFGALLTRREAIYLMIIILLIISIISLYKKLVSKKQFILMNTLIAFPFIWKLFEKTGGYNHEAMDTRNADTIIERLLTRLDSSNLSSYLENLKIQTLNCDYYYFNVLVYIIFIITVLFIIINIFKKKNDEDKRHIFAASIIMLFEFMYIGMVIITQFIGFTLPEYLVAASFSRYVNSISIINFIILGSLLFGKREKLCCKEEIMGTNKRIISKNPRILLIIPAYNEEENILNTYNKIMSYNKKNKTNYEVIVINDGSTDKTKEILENNKIPHINLINNLGIGGAVQTGYKYALENNYDISIQYDGDGQHDVSYVRKLIKPILDGQANLTIGSRFLEKNVSNFKSTKIRRIGITFISNLIKLCTGRKIHDTTSGFRAADKEIIKIFAADYPIDSPEPASFVKIAKLGYATKEVPVSMNERVGGVSSITNKLWKPFYYMFNVSISIIITSLKINGGRGNGN